MCELKNPLEDELDCYEDNQDAREDPLTLQEESLFEEPDVKPDIEELNQGQNITAEELVEGASFLPILGPRRSSSVAAALRSKRIAIRRSGCASAPRRTEDDDIYGHRAFMMSYIPILNSMPLPAAMQARMQISQIINFAFAGQSSAEATPTSIRTENSDII